MKYREEEQFLVNNAEDTMLWKGKLQSGTK